MDSLRLQISLDISHKRAVLFLKGLIVDFLALLDHEKYRKDHKAREDDNFYDI